MSNWRVGSQNWRTVTQDDILSWCGEADGSGRIPEEHEIVPLAALASTQGAHVLQGDQGTLPTCSCSQVGKKIQLHRHLPSFLLVMFYCYSMEKQTCIFSNLVAGGPSRELPLPLVAIIRRYWGKDRLHPTLSSTATFFIIIIFLIINDNEFIVMQLLVNIALLNTWYPLNANCSTIETEHFLSRFTSGKKVKNVDSKANLLIEWF